MNELLQKFSLTFSKAPEEIINLLKSYAKKLKTVDCPKASKQLLKKIEKYKKDLIDFGIPPNLQIAEVNEFMNTGVFLKPDSKPIKKGEFIGIYTGNYEIVFESETQGNHYAYDVAPGIKIKKELLQFVRSTNKKPSVKDSFSIQTNAVNTGNFTRYINHSSVDTNIEAITRRLADGTIEVCLFAAKKILPGHQLLSNYGGQYWSVLPIIPEPILSNSYVINKNGKVSKTKEVIAGRKWANDTHLQKLRNGLELEIEQLSSTLKTALSKAKIPLLPASLEKKIESFEDEILERGLPLNLEMKSQNSLSHWDIYVSNEVKKIKKGSFLGVIGGKWKLSSKNFHGDFLSGIKIKNKSLLLRQDEAFNFTKYISISTVGNLKISMYKKRGSNSYYMVIRALKDILPDERLTIQQFHG